MEGRGMEILSRKRCVPGEKYYVMCQLGSSPSRSNGTLLFENSDADRAWQFYQILEPMTEMSVALLDSHGNLMAFHAGRREQQ
jgi:hypothetical protein